MPEVKWDIALQCTPVDPVFTIATPKLECTQASRITLTHPITTRSRPPPHPYYSRTVCWRHPQRNVTPDPPCFPNSKYHTTSTTTKTNTCHFNPAPIYPDPTGVAPTLHFLLDVYSCVYTYSLAQFSCLINLYGSTWQSSLSRLNTDYTY